MGNGTTATRASAAFPKHERLRKRSEFLAVQGTGRKLHSDHFLVFVRRAPATGTSAPAIANSPTATQAEATDRTRTRVGFTVSKKVGCSVVRNHVKRILREVYRRHKAWFPVAGDLVFVAKASAAELDFAALERELKKFSQRYFTAPPTSAA